MGEQPSSSRRSALPQSGNLVHRPPSAWRGLGVSPIPIEVAFEPGSVCPGSSCSDVRGLRGLCSRPGDKAAAGFLPAASGNTRTPPLAREQRGVAGGPFTQPQARLGRGIRALRDAGAGTGPLPGLGQAYRLASSYAESSVEFSSVPSAGI